MENGGEMVDAAGTGGDTPVLDGRIIKDAEAIMNVDWSPMKQITDKFPKAVPFVINTLMFALLIWNRFMHWASASLFLVVLPLVPTLLVLAKTGSLSRETLIVTSVMQMLSYLNAENKTGGISTFVGYFLCLGVCCYLQDWGLNPTLTFHTLAEIVQYTFNTVLVNGHLLDSFLIGCIMVVTGLNAFSAFKTYGVGFEDHWFWEDVKRCRFKKETPKAIEEDKE